MRLLDADIVIDILRGYQPALDWLESIRGEAISVPGYVIMELIEGTRNQQELRRLLRIVAPWPVVWPTQDGCGQALSTLSRYYLSHRLSAFDALIAECAVGLGATLCTFNVKHFRPLSHLVTEQPYPK